MLFAKTAQAAAQGMEQFRNRTIRKEYWAVVAGVPPDDTGTVDHPLAKRSSIGGQKVQLDESPQAKEAITHWRRITTQSLSAEAGKISLLELFPETGRIAPATGASGKHRHTHLRRRKIRRA